MNLTIHLRPPDRVLVQLFAGFDELLSSCFGQAAPAHDTRGVEQKFRGPGDVASILAGPRHQQIVVANDLGLAIRQNWEGDSRFAAEFARFIGRIGADGNRMNAGSLQAVQVALNPP